MVYWLFAPLALSVGLLVYVYTIHAQGRSTHLFALYTLCTALHALLLFITFTTTDRSLALWLHALRYTLAFPLSDLLFWFLTIDLVYRARRRPRWVWIYSAVAILAHLATTVVALLDFVGLTALFYDKLDLVGPAGPGYSAPPGPLYLVPQLVRLIPLCGALAILVLTFVQGNRARQIRLSASLLPLILYPLVTRVVLQRTGNGELRVGMEALSDLALALGLGFAITRNLFAPIEYALRQALDRLADGVAVLDTAGHVLRVNQVAEQLLGIQERAVRYARYPDLFAGWAISSQDLAKLDAALDSGEFSHTQESQIGIEEPHRHVRVQTSPIRTASGQPLGQMILLTDITPLRNREERLEIAIEVQRRLTEMMATLSSPILPVLEQVIVLPLVGTLTVDRAQLFMRTLLEGIRDHHARIAILDLTGMQDISVEAAYVFFQAVDAAQLLGTQTILVGIQAQAAETLSDLDIDLDALTLFTDLQAGLAYAIKEQQSSA
jgi:PAS domain S-box-containing protein